MTAQKLDIRALAIACGLTWGLGILFLGIVAWLWGWAAPMVELIGSAYVGYAPTLAGSLIGTLWALVDGAIYGALLALFYNCAMKYWNKTPG